MKKIVLLSALTSSLLLASGYRLPETSVNSTALSAAYVANANGADASYYNPANMVFNENKDQLEVDLTYIRLSSIKYKDDISSIRNSSTKVENLYAPSAFFASKEFGNYRFGLAMVVPGGLSKRWDDPYAKLYAKEFTLKIVELNPSLAYKISDKFAVGAGVRFIYSEGVVKSDGTDIGIPIIRDMEADTTEFGYNIAATYKPNKKATVSATYRSNVDLKERGNAKLYLSGTKLYDGGASVTVPLPAVASLAFSYDFGKTTLEVEYDKTYWSKYKELDFEFVDSVPVALKGAFDDPKPRNWKDTNAYRVGITHKYNSKLTIMASIAKDENPEPEKNVGFELPDSDAMIYGAGFRYKYNKKMTVGASVLYDKKDDRKVKNDSANGEFDDASALLITFGASYKF